jgi:hypothetical protein
MVIAPFLLALAAGAPPATVDGVGTEPNMGNTYLSPISTITIRNSGTTSPASGEPADQCADFKLSYHEIRAYIGKASQVTEHDYLHMLDWSPCHASGEITFHNGLTGTWAIQRYRAGSLKLSDGRTLYLYCPRCQAKAFPMTDE